MLTRLARFGLSCAVCAILLAGTAWAATGDVTVGQFLVEIAKVKSLPASDSVTAEASLRAAGANLPRLDHAKVLTQADVAAISAGLGLRVTTSQPTAGFGSGDMDAYLTAFRGELGGTPNTPRNDPGTDPSTKGKKKGHNKSKCDPV